MKMDHISRIKGNIALSTVIKSANILDGAFHGQRSLVGYSPWGAKSWTRKSD